MDVVVNAVWLAYYWAVSTEDEPAVSARESLVLDWPMDFVLIAGATPEEIEGNKLKWAVHMQAKVERLRSFVGVENTNLLRIVMAAADIVKTKADNIKKPTAQQVLTWLKEHITWASFTAPTSPRWSGTWAIGPPFKSAPALCN